MAGQLGKGANTVLMGRAVTVIVKANVQLDVSALLTAGGKVRSDDDFVFYNQPTAPGVNHRPDGVDIDLPRVPADIDKVVVTATVDSGTFADISRLQAAVRVDGAEVATLVPSGLTSETGLILAEVYRLGGTWKVRHVSQGYAAGLAGIATDFGVHINDHRAGVPSAPSAASLPPPPAAPAATPPAPAVNFVKGTVNLDKGGKVLIEKTPEIEAKTWWDSATDYDLYAVVLTADGRQLVCSTFGSEDEPNPTPSVADGAIVHLGDVGREAAGQAVETLRIRMAPEIASVAVVAYSAQSNGTGSFYRYKVGLSVDNKAGTKVLVDARNANRNDRIYTCVIAVIHNRPQGVEIEAMERYSRANSEYRPAFVNGRITMDAGSTNLYK